MFKQVYAAVLLVMLTSLFAGYYIGVHREAVCDDDVEFHHISELHPDAYAGKYAICDGTIVVILD